MLHSKQPWLRSSGHQDTQKSVILERTAPESGLSWMHTLQRGVLLLPKLQTCAIQFLRDGSLHHTGPRIDLNVGENVKVLHSCQCIQGPGCGMASNAGVKFAACLSLIALQ